MLYTIKEFLFFGPSARKKFFYVILGLRPRPQLTYQLILAHTAGPFGPGPLGKGFASQSYCFAPLRKAFNIRGSNFAVANFIWLQRNYWPIAKGGFNLQQTKTPCPNKATRAHFLCGVYFRLGSAKSFAKSKFSLLIRGS